MNREPVIHVENLSKSYDVYQKPQDYIREMITRKTRHDVFWALRNISFDVFEKQRVGIIGPNGAGKSTLLKILTGNLAPTLGRIQVNGKVSALLSMTSSLNPEESGLENIKFSLLLNGVPKKQIAELAEDVIEFAELGSFIYSPVKTYSSGMNARLSFGIATAMDPEIMVVDEVLSVGDGYFLNKAHKRMMELVERGKALIFVSHSINEVRRLCDRVIWLENGSVRTVGDAESVSSLYEQDFRKMQDETLCEENQQIAMDRRFGVGIGDIGEAGSYSVRIVPADNKKGFLDTYFVRKIMLSTSDGSQQEIDMLEEEMDGDKSALELQDCDWGRVYDRNGNLSRTLANKTGKGYGGKILLKQLIPAGRANHKVKLSFEADSMLRKHPLGMEYLDYQSREWKPVDSLTRARLPDGWERVDVEFAPSVVGDEVFRAIKTQFERDAIEEVDFVDCKILREQDQSETYLVDEREPFAVQVKVRANRPIPVMDVSIKIIRSDGYYVFWQSSGLDGENMRNVEGEAMVSFKFDPNYLCAGDYLITVYCANGWDVATNYPYKRMYFQKVDIKRFAVLRQYPELGFGQLNMRVPIVCRVSDSSQESPEE